MNLQQGLTQKPAEAYGRYFLISKEGLTILLTSHFMDEVEALCDEICIIRQGKSVFQGTVEQAKETSGCEKFEDAYLTLSGEEAEE